MALRGNSNDPGWKYAKYCDPDNKSKVKCDFCGHISTRGIFRFKQHIAATDNVAKQCKKATPEAIAECKNHLNRVVVAKSTKRQRDQEVRDDVHVLSGTTYDSGRDDVCVGSSSSEPNKVGPMVKFVRPIDGKSSKEEALRQLSMNEALFKERVHQVSQYVARWVYTHGKLPPICL
jgi:hypothetical protein